MNVRVDVDTRQMKRAMRSLSEGVRGRILQRAVNEGADLVREDTENKAPVGETGRLKENIGTEEVETGSDMVKAADVGHEEEAWYGIFPELGTVEQRAQPHLRPAHDENLDEIQDEIESVILRKLREVEAVYGRDIL